KTRSKYEQRPRKPSHRDPQIVHRTGVVRPQHLTDLKRQLPKQPVDLVNGELSRFSVLYHTLAISGLGAQGIIPDEMTARGSLWAILLYDVAEQIQLGMLRSLLGIGSAPREPRFKHPVPDYVRFEQPPLEQTIEAAPLVGGERLQGRIKYFAYGVIAVE